MTTTITRRLSLPLSDRDYSDIELLRSSKEYRREIPAGIDSNAAVAHAVFEEGMRAIKERAAARVYEEMAKESAEVAARAADRERLTRRGRDRVID
nr:hypothetical protein [uncultured Microbacterium sp.]